MSIELEDPPERTAASLVSGILGDLHHLVVKANVTSQHDVKRALDSLRSSNPIHVILNCVPTGTLPYYMAEYAALESRPPG